jgi:CRP-like cAMP-binding protein
MADDFSGLFSSDTPSEALSAGQVLFHKGEPGNAFYVVKSGELQILDGNHVFEVVGPGGLVGEMALVDGGPRSATVRATTTTEVIPVDERRFLFMVQETPFFAIRVMRLMTARLRTMNERSTTMAAAPTAMF